MVFHAFRIDRATGADDKRLQSLALYHTGASSFQVVATASAVPSPQQCSLLPCQVRFEDGWRCPAAFCVSVIAVNAHWQTSNAHRHAEGAAHRSAGTGGCLYAVRPCCQPVMRTPVVMRTTCCL